MVQTTVLLSQTGGEVFGVYAVDASGNLFSRERLDNWEAFGPMISLGGSCPGRRSDAALSHHRLVLRAACCTLKATIRQSPPCGATMKLLCSAIR